TFAATIVEVIGDSACPTGYQELTVAEAAAQASTICGILGTWDILRLAGGGSMDGPGYNCKTRSFDNRNLGGSLCRKVQAVTKVNGDRNCAKGSALVGTDLARANQDSYCQKLGTWDIVRLADGGSIDGPGYGCGIRDADTRDLGHSLCANLSVIKVGKDGPCPAGTGLASPEAVKNQLASICPDLGTWDIVRLGEGGSMDGPGYGCSVRLKDERGLGNGLCVAR
ncbi:MAG TPA: hypothetical protein VE954_31105, partial [Oligoflexus sp.]|uniref:hypothetical protein n=1 Tax=Oligoflexus sp. TaxID=1971216 RepID=UPI002D2914FF